MTPPKTRLLAAALLALAAGLLLPSMGASAAACDNFRAVAAADGGRVFGSAPGTLVVDADGESPAAQALVTSLGESTGYAGVTYSETVAGNIGLAVEDTSAVPLFATSSYPAQPKAAHSTPVASVEATSELLASKGKAVGGGPASDAAAAGRALATASAECAGDGSIRAAAENAVDLVSIEGVLRIASVRSRATATIDATGRRVLTASTDIEGASVLGQRVGITDRGIVVAGEPTPGPDNPLAAALRDAGITVRVVDAVKDEQQGQVLAPALEITVVGDVEDVGTGPKTTSYTFGRAYALASGQPGTTGGGSGGGATTGTVTTGGAGTTTGGTDGTSGAGFAPSPGTATGGLGTAGDGTGTLPPFSPSGPTSGTGGSQPPLVAGPQARLASASLDNIYPALVVGTGAFLAAWLVFRFVGVRLRWR